MLIACAAAPGMATAAETGTKTLPSSSIYPPRTPEPVFGTRHHYYCYLPSEPCNNEHRVEN